MRKICLVFLLPLLFAFQCEDDDGSTGFETSYFIQNETNTSLFYFGFDDRLIEIEAQSSDLFRSELNNETLPIPPSESIDFSTLQLFRNVDSDIILIYEQTPIDDDQWLFDEPSENRFEYTLVITEELIN